VHGEPDIRLERVTKRFGDMTAVDALDLEMPRGAFYALLGPSGCGKTTTLRMIGGFEEPTDGRVFLGGDDVTERPPLSDSGWVVERLRDVGLVGEDGRLLASRTAVIAGITYNFLPFMILPLYVSLEKIDRRLIEAATDLYASRVTAFRRITLPLALPGIFAGSLLTFIPATGDFINAALLGTPRQFMIGNVIQSKFITILDYPTAAALSFILMTFILICILLYARVLGTSNLTEAAF
jgi:ABC-type proline/glycine betaine transport system permease subunit